MPLFVKRMRRRVHPFSAIGESSPAEGFWDKLVEMTISADVEGLSTLVRQGVSITTVQPGGVTLAHVAAMEGSKQVLQLILETAGSSALLATDALGATPLHWACTVGGVLHHQATSTLATERERFVSFAHGAPSVRATIKWERHAEQNPILISEEKCSEDDGMNKEKEHIEQEGQEQDDTDVKHEEDEKENGNEKDDRGTPQPHTDSLEDERLAFSTPTHDMDGDVLTKAVMMKLDTLTWMLTDERILDYITKTKTLMAGGFVGPAHLASRLEQLLEAGSDNPEQAAQTDSTKLIVTRNRLANYRDANQATPLHWAARFELSGGAVAGSGGFTGRAVKAGERLPLARRLVSLGADVFATDIQGQTPLHLAATAGALCLCEFFVRIAGCEIVALQDCKGQTAVDLARKFCREKKTIDFLRRSMITSSKKNENKT